MISPSQLREATTWVQRSGVATDLEALLRPTGRGRPRQLTVRALLIGLKLSIDTAKTSCLTDVHRVLTRELHRRDQVELGILDSRTGTVVSLHQVRRLFDTLARRV